MSNFEYPLLSISLFLETRDEFGKVQTECILYNMLLVDMKVKEMKRRVAKQMAHSLSYQAKGYVTKCAHPIISTKRIYGSCHKVTLN